jgi:hypothetical protein
MNHSLKQKGIIAPIIVLVSGLVSAFVIAPITGQNAIEKEYRGDFSRWEEREKDIQKNVINWFKPSEIEAFTKDFENVKSSYKNAKTLYEQKKKSYSAMELQDAYTEMQVFKSSEYSFNSRYNNLINLKEKTKKEIEGITAQQKMLASNVESLRGKIKESPFEERHKKALLDCLGVFGTSNNKIDNSLQLISEFYSPNYESKSAVSQYVLITNTAIAETESKRMMGSYEYTNNLFVGFVNAPATVPNSIISLSRNINLIKLETNSSTSQPKMLVSGSPAMKRTDSLLKICMNLLPQAQIKSANKEYIDALFILEKLAPYEKALTNEYNTQKESYNNFIAQYNAIDKDLKSTKSASISSSDRSSYDRLSNEAFLAQQLAWQYAMAGNWMYAQNQLQTSSEKSNKVYNLAFKKPSTRSYSSSSSSGSGSKNYSSSSNSGSKSSSGSSSGSSYSSSSKKSDSRSWSSSSSSSSKKSSSSSSSSSSRRSDSRSWGSSSRKKR